MLQIRLTYPSIKKIPLHLEVNEWVRTDIELLTYVMTVVHAMRAKLPRKHNVNILTDLINLYVTIGAKTNGVSPDGNRLGPRYKGNCEMVISVQKPSKLLSKCGDIARFIEDDEIEMALAALRRGCKNYKKAGENV